MTLFRRFCSHRRFCLCPFACFGLSLPFGPFSSRRLPLIGIFFLSAQPPFDSHRPYVLSCSSCCHPPGGLLSLPFFNSPRSAQLLSSPHPCQKYTSMSPSFLAPFVLLVPDACNLPSPCNRLLSFPSFIFCPHGCCSLCPPPPCTRGPCPRVPILPIPPREQLFDVPFLLSCKPLYLPHKTPLVHCKSV